MISYHGLKFQRRIAYDIDCTLADSQEYYFTACESKMPNARRLSLVELIREYHYAERVPEWRDNKQVMNLIEEMRNGNGHQTRIPLLKGAKQALERIQEDIATGAYVTGRSELVRKGTLQFLQEHKLPNAPVYLRPGGIKQERWRVWKARIINNMFPLIQGVVDDDPQIPSELQKLGYEGIMIIFGKSTHPAANEQYVPCPDWATTADKLPALFDELAGRL